MRFYNMSTEDEFKSLITAKTFDDIKQLLGLPEDVPVIVSDTLGDSNGTANVGDFKHDNTIHKIEINVKLKTDVSNNQNNNLEGLILLNDEEVGMKTYGHYTNLKYNYSVEITGLNKSRIRQLQLTLSKFKQNQKGITYHNFKYPTFLNYEMLEIFKNILEIRNRVNNQEMKLGEYLKNASYDNLNVITNIVKDEERSSAVLESFQLSVLGLLADVSQLTKEDNGFMVTFEYALTPKWLTEFNVDFPFMIWNTVLPQHLVIQEDINKRDAIEIEELNIPNTPYSLKEEVKHISSLFDRKDSYFRIPYYDNNAQCTPTTNTNIMFSVLNQVDPDNNRELFNLKELGSIILDPKVIDFLESGEWGGLAQRFGTIFFVELYEDNYKLTADSLVVDELLNIRTTFDMRIKSTYRVTFSVLMNLTLLDDLTLERALEFLGQEISVIDVVDFVDLYALHNQETINKKSRTTYLEAFRYGNMLSSIVAVRKD